MQKSVFVNCCFFSYFPGFGEEPLNPQESIREKTHLVRIHFQEWILIYQDNFEYFAEINIIVSIIFKILRDCNLTNESQICNETKYFSGRHIKTFVEKLITVCIFHGVTTDFRKTIIWKKVTSITKSREFSKIFDHIWNILWLHLINAEKFIPWYCVNVIMTLCKYYFTMEELWICFKESP